MSWLWLERLNSEALCAFTPFPVTQASEKQDQSKQETSPFVVLKAAARPLFYPGADWPHPSPLPPHQPTAQKERDVLLAWVTLSLQPWAVLQLTIERSGSSGHSLIWGAQRLSVESHWSERNEGAGHPWKRFGRFRGERKFCCCAWFPLERMDKQSRAGSI